MGFLHDDNGQLSSNRLRGLINTLAGIAIAFFAVWKAALSVSDTGSLDVGPGIVAIVLGLCGITAVNHILSKKDERK